MCRGSLRMSSGMTNGTEISLSEDSGLRISEEMVVTVAGDGEGADGSGTEKIYVIVSQRDENLVIKENENSSITDGVEQDNVDEDYSPEEPQDEDEDFTVEVEEAPAKKKRGRPKKTVTDPRGREFCCEHCGKTFKQLNVFRVHTRIHTGERPYQCELCGMSFNQIGTLKDHQKIHTGEKPYPCPHCPSRFTNKTRLTRHVRTHTGERPYKCEFCQV